MPNSSQILNNHFEYLMAFLNDNLTKVNSNSKLAMLLYSTLQPQDYMCTL